MRLLTHKILTLTPSILSEGPLIKGSIPIGRFQNAGPILSRSFSAYAQQAGNNATRVKRWQSDVYKSANFRRRGSSTRSKSAWEQQSIGPATSPKRSNAAPLLGVLFGASALAFLGSSIVSNVDDVQVDPIKPSENVDLEDTEEVRKIRLTEVPKHDQHASTKWVIREASVYDITDFVEAHPGGEIVLRACGGSIDPYWKIIAIHQKPEVYDILNQFYIGEIDERDLDSSGHVDWTVLGDEAGKHIVDDPFKYDPERDENLIVRTAKPCNAETPGSLLTDFLTPLRLFFVRNHLWVPRAEESPQSITIEFSDGEEKTYSLDELKRKFKEHTITATLQCSGNRRSHMSKAGKTAGLQWDVGAIGTAEFSGARLRDVLRDSGYCVDGDCPAPKQCDSEDTDKHIHFTSPSDTYSVSIPLQTVLNPQADVLLAWDMNGEPINRDHGGPLRAVVPGTTAARSVKWLGRISISCDEAQGQYQQRDYKCFGPNLKQTDVTTQDWDEAQAIQETPVQSAITNILKANGNGKTTAQGFAFSGGGRSIVRVDVSPDGGKTWKQAQLQQDKAKGSKRWAWTLWSIEWPKDELKVGQETEFVVKAVDEAYNTQPQTFDSTWNFRGLLANSWHSQKMAAAA